MSIIITTSINQLVMSMKLVSLMKTASTPNSSLKIMPQNAFITLTYIFNACLPLKHNPECLKTVQRIILKKPDIPAE